MPERDASQEALEQVQKITESEPVNGEDLLSSPDLKRQLREAKERKPSVQPSHRVSSPSSSPEKFVSRFLACLRSPL